MNRPARLNGPRLWLGTGVALVAVVVGMLTLSTLIAAGTWSSTAIWVTLPVAALVVVLRQVVRSRVAPSAWGLLAAVTLVAAWYGDAEPGLSVPAPTAETFERLRLLVESGAKAINDGRIPVEPTRGIELLVVAGTVATYLLVELVALGLGRGALGSLPLVALWAPTIAFERSPGFWLEAAGGTTFILLLALTRTRSRRNDRSVTQEAPIAAGAAAALAVGALVVGSAATALPFYGSVTLPGMGGEGIDSPLRVSTDLDMRSDLEARSDRPLLRYSGDGTVIDALRMYTMTDFDGVEWHAGRSGGLPRGASGLLWPDEEVTDGIDPDEVGQVDVEVLALNQDHLPIPTEPVVTDLGGTWFYDARTDEVRSSGGTTRGVSYSLEVWPRDLSADGLRADRAGDPGALQAYLGVPETEHAADIAALAREITAGATTTYDQALALQSYLRNAQNFEYSTELGPPLTQDAVWDFLTNRRGYCVQYATAMTIMARTVGIPSRMAVGFLSGKPVEGSPGEFLVSGRQAHTWPELYFEDAGWVRFEPTPARQTGAPPVYADPFAGTPQGPDGQIPTSTALPSGSATSLPVGPTGAPSGYVTLGSTDLPILAVVGMATALVLAAAAVVVLVLRRRRIQARIPHSPEEWWTRLRERLAAHGVVWTDATTPRQAAEVVRGRFPSALDADPADLLQARHALGDLVAALETERYTNRDVDVTGEQMGAWVDAVERPLGTPVTAADR